MIKKLLLLSVFLFCYYLAQAQEQFIIYNNDAEKSLLIVAKTPREYLKLALVSETSEYNAEQILTKTDEYIKQLSWNPDQKSEKRLTQLFQTVHAAYLQKYDGKALIKQLFDTHEYQCVGASVFYAYILEQLNIPYQLKQTPTHVYIVAYPESLNVTLETGEPGIQYVGADAQTKATIVKELVKEKYIDGTYADNSGVDKAFNDFFFAQTNLSFKEAVALLYFNKAVDNADNSDKGIAYSNICKAQILHPVRKYDYYRNQVLDDLIKNFKFNDFREWQALTYALNSQPGDDNNKFIEYQFNDLIQNKLWKLSQKEKVDTVYNYLMSNVKDETVKADLEDNYLMENARYAMLANKFGDAQKYLEEAYRKNPENQLKKSLLIEVVAHKFQNQAGSKQNIDFLDAYVVKFPGLKNDLGLRTIYLYNYAYMGYASFSKMDGANGIKYMKLMMDELDTHPDVQKNEIQIASVFAQASIWYYQKQGKQKAMEILTVGLKYAPDNAELMRKLHVFKTN